MAIEFAGAGSPLSPPQFDGARDTLAVDDATLWAVLTVETKGFGFLKDRRPKILFERHIFHRRTGGRFDAVAPDLSNPVQGGYATGGDAAEYARLTRAIALDRKAALESASWGLGQVMGFNAQAAGYADAETMVAAFVAGEGAQLQAVARFISGQPKLLQAARSGAWTDFARLYNGPSYAQNAYDRKLKDNHAAYARGPLPDLDLRAAQACLVYLGYDPRGVDGVMGDHTRTCLTQFQTTAGLPATGHLDAASLAALKARAGV